MPTFKIIQRRIKKDGTGEINIRITHNRKIAYIRTGYYVKPSQLKDGIIIKHSDSALLNLNIENKKSEILQNFLRQDLLGEDFNINKATGKRGESSETMFGAIKHIMRTYEIEKKVASYNRMKTNLEYIQKAWEKDIYIDDLTKLHVEKYANYRYTLGNTPSTVKKNLADLATVLNRVGFKKNNPFADYAQTIIARPVKREKLTADQIKALEQVKLFGLADIARDMYLFSFYTHGMRFENVATFKREYIRGDHIHYQMNKGDDFREIFIHPKLKGIIDKYFHTHTLYLFPVVKETHNDWNKKEIIGKANALINNFITNAAQKAGIEIHISFHTARHTFAYLSKKRMVSINVIQDALGHSKASTTQGYLKSLSDDEINEAVKAVYE